MWGCDSKSILLTKKKRKSNLIFKRNEAYVHELGSIRIIEQPDDCIGETWYEFGKISIGPNIKWPILPQLQIVYSHIKNTHINPADPFQRHQRHLLAYSQFNNLCLPASMLLAWINCPSCALLCWVTVCLNGSQVDLITLQTNWNVFVDKIAKLHERAVLPNQAEILNFLFTQYKMVSTKLNL